MGDCGMTWQEQINRIGRQQAELRAFIAEQSEIMAEHIKLNRDAVLSPWQIVIAGMIAGATLFGGGMAFAKFIGL
ncbi:hypothetical protein HUU61_00725 [Rhodopseudomonas palustris]|nr:hypothetical protein [Rhodopseudomonas palustris]